MLGCQVGTLITHSQSSVAKFRIQLFFFKPVNYFGLDRGKNNPVDFQRRYANLHIIELKPLSFLWRFLGFFVLCVCVCACFVVVVVV